MDDKTRSILRRCLRALEEPLEAYTVAAICPYGSIDVEALKDPLEFGLAYSEPIGWNLDDLRQELQALLVVEEEPTVLLTDALAAMRRSGSRPLSSAMAASIYAAVAAVLGRADAEITIREAESACEFRLLSQRNFGRKRLWILRETIKGVK
jgi:hypothetical protein